RGGGSGCFMEAVGGIRARNVRGVLTCALPIYNKLEWIADIHWDLVIIDESHEAVDTRKTQFALYKIKKDYLLHLSGTPFKQLAGDDFSSEKIFNWIYRDEQEAKENWDEEETGENNPYAELL